MKRRKQCLLTLSIWILGNSLAKAKIRLFREVSTYPVVYIDDLEILSMEHSCK
jgi:hypothetical protein